MSIQKAAATLNLLNTHLPTIGQLVDSQIEAVPFMRGVFLRAGMPPVDVDESEKLVAVLVDIVKSP